MLCGPAGKLYLYAGGEPIADHCEDQVKDAGNAIDRQRALANLTEKEIIGEIIQQGYQQCQRNWHRGTDNMLVGNGYLHNLFGVGLFFM